MKEARQVGVSGLAYCKFQNWRLLHFKFLGKRREPKVIDFLCASRSALFFLIGALALLLELLTLLLQTGTLLFKALAAFFIQRAFVFQSLTGLDLALGL